jgi:hypothetical protein
MFESKITTPSIFAQIWILFGLNNSKINNVKLLAKRYKQQESHNGISIASRKHINVTMIIDKCMRASDICKYKARLYKWLNVVLIIFASFLSPASGIIGTTVSTGVGYIFAAFASILTVFMFLSKWGQLSETYASYALEFRRAASSNNPEDEYNLIHSKIDSGILNIYLLDNKNDDVCCGCCCYKNTDYIIIDESANTFTSFV